MQTYIWRQIYGRCIRNKKISINYTNVQIENGLSVLHNIVCLNMILLYANTNWSDIIPIMCTWSQSYFIYDLFNQMKKKKPSALMIIHHLASFIAESYLYLIYENKHDINGKAVLWGFFYSELSNFPHYFIDHYKNRVPGELNYVDPVWYMLNSMSFFYFRGTVGWYFLFMNPVTIHTLWWLIFGFWILSLYWAILLALKYIHKRKDSKIKFVGMYDYFLEDDSDSE